MWFDYRAKGHGSKTAVGSDSGMLEQGNRSIFLSRGDGELEVESEA